jgi:multiple sugar transport system permease protein
VSIAPATRATLVAPLPAQERRRAKARAGWRRRGVVLVFLSPWLVGVTIFFAYPLLMSVYLSFTHFDNLSAPRWIGLANYRYMFTADPLVGVAVRNSLWLMVFAVPLYVLSAFGIALMVSRVKRGSGAFRTIFYLPALAPPVAATLGFVYILNPANGPINVILAHLGIQGPLWFQSPEWAKPSLVLLGIWGIGNLFIIFLAAILDVPKHLYESAELDGTNGLQRLRYVTLPIISPVILFSVVISVIAAMQYFTQAYVAANIASGQASQAGDITVNLGFPQGSTLFYPILLYNDGFRAFSMGYASAMAVLLFIVAFAVTAIILVNSRRWVHYGGAVR